VTELEIVLPKWGLTMTEATVVRWLKAPGDTVQKDEPLVEVETEKANAEVEASADGIVATLLHPEGAIVGVGEPLAVLEVEAGAALPTVGASPTPRPAQEPSTSGATAPSTAAQAPAESARSDRRGGRASPVARRIAAELGVELAELEGTGARGLITEADVRTAAAQPRTEASAASLEVIRTETLTGRRKTIGDALSLNLASSPQVTLTRSTGASALSEVKSEHPGAHSVTDLIVAAVAWTLTDHPVVNAHLVGNELRYFDQVNIGLAVDLEGGLVVPVLRDAARLSLAEIHAQRLASIETVRAGTLTPADLMDATFTISNLGAWGVDGFTPIINPPQVGILGVGRLEDRPAVIDSEVTIRPELTLSLTFDHRAMDGRGAAEFLGDLAMLLASRDVFLTKLADAEASAGADPAR